MKAKVIATGEIVDVEKREDGEDWTYQYIGPGILFKSSELDFHIEDDDKDILDYLSEVNEITQDESHLELTGYIARDKCGIIYIYDSEPHIISDIYTTECANSLQLPSEHFPSIQFGDDPVKATISINIIE